VIGHHPSLVIPPAVVEWKPGRRSISPYFCVSRYYEFRKVAMSNKSVDCACHAPLVDDHAPSHHLERLRAARRFSSACLRGIMPHS
jgi:hypothetical protein